MLESFAKLLATWFGNPIRGLVTIMLSSIITILLWQYPPFANAMNDKFWRWPCLTLIVSATGLATYPISSRWAGRQARKQEEAAGKKIIARLGRLTPNEKHTLSQYLRTESTTFAFGIEGGATNTLARDGILTLIHDISGKLITYTPLTYAINEIAWEHLKSHPELLDRRR